MTIPSANLRRLKKIAAEAAAKSSPGGRLRSANLLRRRSPPPIPGGARFGARVLVRTPAAATARAEAPLVLPATLVRAVVVSAEYEHGYLELEVVYEGASPPGEDPFATARCRGTGSSRTRRRVLCVVRQHRPGSLLPSRRRDRKLEDASLGGVA